MLRRWLSLCAILGSLLSPAAADAATPPDCRMADRFAALQQQIPAITGACASNALTAANGDELQRTGKGLLVFRAASETPAFTDGYRTWALGPLGLQERLNTQRFAWEQAGTKTAVLGASFAHATPRLAVVATTIGTTAGTLRFDLAGSGFQSNERVTLQGSYAPLQGGSSPRACRIIPLGPVQVRADADGNFRASISTPNPHTGVNYVIRAAGESSGPSNLALSAVTPNC